MCQVDFNKAHNYQIWLNTFSESRAVYVLSLTQRYGRVNRSSFATFSYDCTWKQLVKKSCQYNLSYSWRRMCGRKENQNKCLIHENLRVSQLFKINIIGCQETLNLIIMFITSHQQTLSRASWIHSTSSYVYCYTRLYLIKSLPFVSSH